MDEQPDIKLQKIPEIFKTHGYTYQLIKRVNTIALYKQIGHFIGGRAEAYEIHKVRRIAIPYGNIRYATMISKSYTHYEKLAGNNEFGCYGWSFSTLEEANKEFDYQTTKEIDKF